MNKLKITTGEWIKRLAFTPDENECIEVKNSELVTIGVGEETGRSYKAVALFGHTSKPEVHANADLMEGDIFRPDHVGCELSRKRTECALWLKAQMLKDPIAQ